MYNTLFSLLLATSAMSGYPDDEGSYGGFGSYGTFCGGYSSPGRFSDCSGQGGISSPNTGWIIPNGQGSFQIEKRLCEIGKCLAELEKRFTKLEKTVEFQGQKLKVTEKDTIEQDSVAKEMDRRFIEFRLEINKTLGEAVKTQGNNIDLKEKLTEIDHRLAKILEEQAAVRVEAIQPPAIQPGEKKMDELLIVLKDSFRNDKKLVDALIKIGSGLEKFQQPAPVKTQPPFGKDLGIQNTNRGTIIVNLPQDAMLYVNEQVSNPGTNVRTFISPSLEPGKTYFYTVRCELKRQDRVVTETTRIYFHPGSEVVVNFNHLDAAPPNLVTTQTSTKAKTN